MSMNEFVGYVGDPDFHDGHIVSVDRGEGTVRVQVRGASGREYAVDFFGARTVRSERPEGMMIYALTELTAEPPLRLFAFPNWDEEDKALLEIEAERFSVTETKSATTRT